MRAFVKLIAVLVVLTSLFVLGYGAYWTNPTAFLTKMKLIAGAKRSGERQLERGMICDFESPKDIMAWQSSGCGLYLSTDYHRAGRSCGRISFDGGTIYAGTKLQDYIFGPGSHRDWSSFERFSFWLKNGSMEEIDLDIQVKDAGERRFHHGVHLGPVAEKRVSVDLERMGHTVDLMRIASIIIGTACSIGEVDVYVDEVKLEGEGDQLGRPYITFSGLEIPPVAYRGRTFHFDGSLRAEKPVPGDYRIFLHIYPEDQASVVKTSERVGLINADHDPPVRTTRWAVGVDQPVGPLEIYIPGDNPSGTYIIEMGLFNPRSPGRGERGVEYQGAYDFAGSYPKCRYANEGMSGYVVGRMEVN